MLRAKIESMIGKSYLSARTLANIDEIEYRRSTMKDQLSSLSPLARSEGRQLRDWTILCNRKLSCKFPTSEARILFQGNLSAICSGQNGSESGFSLSISVFSCQSLLSQCSFLVSHRPWGMWETRRGSIISETLSSAGASPPAALHLVGFRVRKFIYLAQPSSPVGAQNTSKERKICNGASSLDYTAFPNILCLLDGWG